MIPIEQQVCSLWLAKKLKELGVKQESIFYWHNGKIACPLFEEYNVVLNNWFSAFTASELGEMLPVSFWRGILSKYWLTIRVMESPNPKYEINYMFYVNELFPTIKDDKLSEALGNALCLLIENGYVKAEEL